MADPLFKVGDVVEVYFDDLTSNWSQLHHGKHYRVASNWDFDHNRRRWAYRMVEDHAFFEESLRKVDDTPFGRSLHGYLRRELHG